MSIKNAFMRILLLFSTAEAGILVENARCTNSDGREGVCRASDDCPEPQGSPIRRRSRRFSCNNRNLVCCPYGGRRRSSVQKAMYAKPKLTHNDMCSARAGAQPPDPSSGCCGRELDAVNRIVGGTTAELEQYPWMVLFEYRNDQNEKTQHICSGSLVSSRYVLTAKHCITAAARDHAKPVAVILAEYDLRTKEDCMETEEGGTNCISSTRVEVEAVTLHPTRDISLIKMASAAPYTDVIRPICLPATDISTNPTPDLSFHVSGWGLISRFSTRTSFVKKQIQVPFIASEKCQAIYRESRRMHPEERPICAGGEEGHDSCNGDSGGPLMYHNGRHMEAVGVISFGSSNCGQPGIPAVHVNVHHARDWIVVNMV